MSQQGLKIGQKEFDAMSPDQQRQFMREVLVDGKHTPDIDVLRRMSREEVLRLMGEVFGKGKK
jgi:hypothetical protein